MPSPDELRGLRAELDDLIAKARVLQGRIESLERDARAERAAFQAGPAAYAEPPPSAPVIPPPRPAFEPPPLPAHLTSPGRPQAPVVKPEPVSARPARPPLRPPSPTVGDRVRAYISTRVDTTQKGWEMALATYVLPRIGVLVLTISVVFGLTMAANRGGPAARVGLGYLVCAALLIVAWRLERKYQFYARVLFSGGFALSYFVTFATHYVDYAKVIERAPITLALLTAVVLVWAAFAQLRQSRMMALMVTVLGHLTFTIATLFTDDLGPYPVAGLVVLALGSAFFLLRNRWYYVAWAGIVGSYCNHFLWMANAEGGETPFEFWASIGLVSSYFAIFAIAELLSHEDVRRKAVPVWFRTFFVTLNTAGFFALGTLTVNGFPFSETEHDLFRYILAAVLFGLGFAYLHIHGKDPLYNTYLTKAVVIFTLGLAFTFGGNALSASLSVEAAALLVSARRSGLLVTRLLAIGVAVLAFLQAASVLMTQAAIAYDADGYSALLVQSALTVLGLWFMAVLYAKTDWAIRSPEFAWLSTDNRVMLWQFDLAAPPFSTAMRKPLDGQLYPYGFALAGVLLFIPYVSVLTAPEHSVAAFACGALVLAIAAAVLSAQSLGLSSVVLAVATWCVGAAQWAGFADGAPSNVAAVIALAALICVALASETWMIPSRAGLAFHQSIWGPYVLYGVFAWLLGLHLEARFDGVGPAIAVAAAAAAMAGGYLLLHSGALSAAAVFLLAMALYEWLRINRHEWPDAWLAIAAGLTLLGLAGDRFFTWTRRGPLAVYTGPAMLVIVWPIALHVAHNKPPEPWVALCVAGAAYGFLIYSAGFRSMTAAALSVLTAAYASSFAVFRAYDQSWDITPMSLAFGACAIYWIALEREDAFAGRRLNARLNVPVHAAFIAMATVLGVIALERVPAFSDFYLTISWTVLAPVAFGISIATRETFYRYAGLSVLALALARAFFHDAPNLEGLYRVAAFGVLGIVLLIVAFGYIYAVDRIRGREGSPTDPE